MNAKDVYKQTEAVEAFAFFSMLIKSCVEWEWESRNVAEASGCASVYLSVLDQAWQEKIGLPLKHSTCFSLNPVMLKAFHQKLSSGSYNRYF